MLPRALKAIGILLLFWDRNLLEGFEQATECVRNSGWVGLRWMNSRLNQSCKRIPIWQEDNTSVFLMNSVIKENVYKWGKESESMCVVIIFKVCILELNINNLIIKQFIKLVTKIFYQVTLRQLQEQLASHLKNFVCQSLYWKIHHIVILIWMRHGLQRRNYFK